MEPLVIAMPVVDDDQLWAVAGTFVVGADGKPTIVAYEVRLVPWDEAASDDERRIIANQVLAQVRAHAGEELPAPAAAYSKRGIPRLVFDQASVAKLVEFGYQREMPHYRAIGEAIEHGQTAIVEGTDGLLGRRDALVAAGFGEVPKKRGRPAPDRLETLRWCRAVDDGLSGDKTYKAIADELHVSVNTLRRRMDYASDRCAPPLMWTPRQGSRRRMTDAARAELTELENQAAENDPRRH